MWGKLPFLAVLIGIFGVYSGNAFGDWYCGDNTYLTGNNQCQSCPSGYTSLSIDEPGDETDCWISDGSGGRIYYDPDANSGGSGGSSGGKTGGNTGGGSAQAGVRPGQNNGSGGGMSHGGSGGTSGTPDSHGCYNGQYYSNGNCQGCPRGYPNSDKNATIIEQCYKVNGHSGGRTKRRL